MKPLRLSLASLEGGEVRAFRRAFGKLRNELTTNWRLVDEGDADLHVVDIDSMYGHMDWLQLTSEGQRTALYTTAEYEHEDELVLSKPLRSGQLVAVLNAVASEHGVVPAKPQAGTDDATAEEGRDDAGAATAGQHDASGTSAQAKNRPPEVTPESASAGVDPELAAQLSSAGIPLVTPTLGVSPESDTGQDGTADVPASEEYMWPEQEVWLEGRSGDSLRQFDMTLTAEFEKVMDQDAAAEQPAASAAAGTAKSAPEGTAKPEPADKTTAALGEASGSAEGATLPSEMGLAAWLEAHPDDGPLRGADGRSPMGPGNNGESVAEGLDALFEREVPSELIPTAEVPSGPRRVSDMTADGGKSAGRDDGPASRLARMSLAEALLSRALDRPGTLVVAGAVWSLDPAEDVYYGPAVIKPLVAMLDEPASALGRLDDTELEALRNNESHSLDRLRWLAGLLSSPGRLNDRLEVGVAYKLTRWPRIEREYPRHFRIATAMFKEGGTLLQLAEMSGASADDVADFMNACDAVGLIEPVYAAPDDDGGDVPRGRGSVMSRLRNTLGR